MNANANNNNNNNRIRNTVLRAVFIGDTEVGKTSLLNSYFDVQFNELIFQTYGLDKYDKNIIIEDKTYKIIIWDTPGRERFRNQIRFSFRNSKIIFLVFDMTKKKSFLELDRFLEYIQEYSDNINKFTFVLIGNKEDLSDQWQIREKDAKKFAEIIHAKFFLSSAKTAPDKFKKFLDDFFEDYITKHKEELEQAQANQRQRVINNNNNRIRRRNTCY